MISERPNPANADEVIVSKRELKCLERLARVGRCYIEAEEAADAAGEAKDREYAARNILRDSAKNCQGKEDKE